MIGKLLGEVADAIGASADELTALDRAIGDGDHGFNLKRGFDAVTALGTALDAMPLGQALHKAGMTLVMKVGGASGPLYGSLLIGIGKSLSGLAEGERPGRADLAAALEAGVEAVRQRGRSDTGDKTMLDVLAPVCESLRDGVARSVEDAPLLDALTDAAGRGLEATRALQARKGRASFLGARSVGHLDPGARSAQIIVETVCANLRGRE